MTWIEKARKVYHERGYLVIARQTPCRIGHLVEAVNLQGKFSALLPQPFRVVAETNLADYATQHTLAKERLQEMENFHYFYRIMTD